MNNNAKYRSHLLAQGFPKHLLFFISSTPPIVREFRMNMVNIFTLYSTNLKTFFNFLRNLEKLHDFVFLFES